MHGRLHTYKAQAELHSIKVSGEVATEDMVAATGSPRLQQKSSKLKITYHSRFSMLMKLDYAGGGGIPDCSYVAKEEKTIPRLKVANDRLNLLLGGNAAGDCKIKPLLVYHSENLRTFKNTVKVLLPAVWKSKPKAWMTQFYMTGFFHP
jgi:hypothetical protein